VLAGIGLSRLDARIGAAAVLIVAILGAGDQQVIRETGAHNWPSYPVGPGGYYMDYASAAAFVARRVRVGDGIVYQARQHQDSWLMVGYGLQYYLARDMPNGMPVPHELFIARTAAQAGTLYPEPCQRPAACLGAEPRIWVIGVGRQTSPYQAVTPAQAEVLRPRYRLSLVKHQRSLTMFLLTRAGPRGTRDNRPPVNARMKR
jgi:mannosyltransferase